MTISRIGGVLRLLVGKSPKTRVVGNSPKTSEPCLQMTIPAKLQPQHQHVIPCVNIRGLHCSFIKHASQIFHACFPVGSRSSFTRAGSASAAGVARQWCHTFDLSAPMGEAVLAKSGLVSARRLILDEASVDKLFRNSRIWGMSGFVAIYRHASDFLVS